ncbi:MAG: hypothetical protein CMJ81_04755 [Planctomycetaceae bacterium]|nr:hypothetical protein [Planctomycetaceae bacterium]MBP61732.1 hypothetical protein [Planctomycetaceae bacterium]
MTFRCQRLTQPASGRCCAITNGKLLWQKIDLDPLWLPLASHRSNKICEYSKGKTTCPHPHHRTKAVHPALDECNQHPNSTQKREYDTNDAQSCLLALKQMNENQNETDQAAKPGYAVDEIGRPTERSS